MLYGKFHRGFTVGAVHTAPSFHPNRGNPVSLETRCLSLSHGFFQPAPVFKQTIFSCGFSQPRSSKSLAATSVAAPS